MLLLALHEVGDEKQHSLTMAIIDVRTIIFQKFYIGVINCATNSVSVPIPNSKFTNCDNSKVGRYCSIAPDVNMMGLQHPTDRFSISHIVYERHYPAKNGY